MKSQEIFKRSHFLKKFVKAEECLQILALTQRNLFNPVNPLQLEGAPSLTEEARRP